MFAFCTGARIISGGVFLSIANLQISRRISLVSWLHLRITNVSLAGDGTVFWSLHSLCVVRNGIAGVIIRHHTYHLTPADDYKLLYVSVLNIAQTTIRPLL